MEGDDINRYEVLTIQLILDNSVSHYEDIEKSTGKSRKTINKYLNNLTEEVKKYHVQLIRKRNVGIYFEGDTKALRAAVSGKEILPSQANKQQIILTLLSDLLVRDTAITVQALCEKYFVSRTTMENYLQEIRAFLEKRSAVLTSDHEGLFIEAPERIKRQLISEVLQNYWGGGDYLTDTGQNNEFKVNVPRELRKLFDHETFTKVEKTLNEFQRISTIKLNDFEFQSLAVHLIIAIQRIKKGEMLKEDSYLPKNTVVSETITLSELLEKAFAIKIPFNERRYINIHILAANAKKKEQGMLSSVEYEASSVSDNNLSEFLRSALSEYDETLVSNLTLHLIPALRRFSLGLSIKNPYTSEIKRNFPLAYNDAVDLSLKIEHKFAVHINDDEIAYIALHIETYNERKNENLTAVLVCSTGLGTARLLEQRINKYFSNSLTITRVVSVLELKNQSVPEDLVISTVGVSLPDKQVIVVPPFLDDSSKNKIQLVLDKSTSTTKNASAFMKLLHPELIMIETAKISKNQVIRKVSEQLQRFGYALPGIDQAAIKREKLASTQIEFVAMPHAPVAFVKQPCISIYVNSQGVQWAQGKVRVVFFLAMNETVKNSLDKIYSYFNELLEDKQLLKRVARAKTSAEVIKMLGGERIVEQK